MRRITALLLSITLLFVGIPTVLVSADIFYNDNFKISTSGTYEFVYADPEPASTVEGSGIDLRPEDALETFDDEWTDAVESTAKILNHSEAKKAKTTENTSISTYTDKARGYSIFAAYDVYLTSDSSIAIVSYGDGGKAVGPSLTLTADTNGNVTAVGQGDADSKPKTTLTTELRHGTWYRVVAEYPQVAITDENDNITGTKLGNTTYTIYRIDPSDPSKVSGIAASALSIAPRNLSGRGMTSLGLKVSGDVYIDNQIAYKAGGDEPTPTPTLTPTSKPTPTPTPKPTPTPYSIGINLTSSISADNRIVFIDVTAYGVEKISDFNIALELPDNVVQSCYAYGSKSFISNLVDNVYYVAFLDTTRQGVVFENNHLATIEIKLNKPITESCTFSLSDDTAIYGDDYTVTISKGTMKSSSTTINPLTSTELAKITSGTDGNIQWNYMDNTLYIKGSGEMNDYTIKPAPWSHKNDDIKEIVFEENVTSIGTRAIAGMTQLERIEIPDSVTSIGENAFNGCSNLTNLTLGNGIQSISKNAFLGCYNLESVYVKDFATWFGIDFERESNKEIYSNPMTYAKHLYYNGNEINKSNNIVIPDSLQGPIHSEAFIGFDDITSITLPSTGQTLSNILGEVPDTLTKVTVTSRDIPEAFAKDCTNIARVNINSKVSAIGENAFNGCTNLRFLTIEEGVKKISQNAFKNCNSLSEVTIPMSVTSIVGAGVFPQTTVICGYSGSAAEEYAENYGYAFKMLEMDNLHTSSEAKRVLNDIVIDTTADIDLSDKLLHVALYTSDGVLTDYAIVPTKNSKNNVFDVLFKENPTAAYAKVFIWDSLSTMIPSANSEMIYIGN